MEKCTLQVHVCSIPNGRVKVSIVPIEWNFRLSGIMGWNYSTCSSGNKMLFSVALVSNDQVINIFVLKKSSAEYFWSCYILFHRDKMLYQQLLVELYSQCPKVINWLSDLQGSIFDGQLSQSTITQVNFSPVDICMLSLFL